MRNKEIGEYFEEFLPDSQNKAYYLIKLNEGKFHLDILWREITFGYDRKRDVNALLISDIIEILNTILTLEHNDCIVFKYIKYDEIYYDYYMYDIDDKNWFPINEDRYRQLEELGPLTEIF